MRLHVLALATSLAAPLPAFAADPLTLMLDWYVNPDHAPIIIAAEKGWFDEAGLAVEIIAPADPSEPPKLVAAGKIDLAIGYQPQLHLQHAEGLPLMRVGTLIASPLNCLMVKADGPVQGLADLKGRKIGYSVSGFEAALMGGMLAGAGLSAADVEMVNVNWSLTPALLTGQVDAVIGAFRNFELTQMQLAGSEGRCFYPEEEGLPTWDELIFLAHAETMDRDRLRRFMAVIERATTWARNHPSDAKALFIGTDPALGDALNDAAWEATLPRFAPSPAALDHGRYAAFGAFLAAQGMIPAATPVASLAVDLNAEAP